jgi:hypothetical protein
MKWRFAIWALFGACMVPFDELHSISGTITGRAHGMEMSLPMFVVAGLAIGAIQLNVLRPPPHSARYAAACACLFAAAYVPTLRNLWRWWRNPAPADAAFPAPNASRMPAS